MGGIIQYFSFCDWIISLSIISLRIHQYCCILQNFFFSSLNSIPSYVYSNFNLYILLMDVWVVSTSWLPYSFCDFQFLKCFLLPLAVFSCIATCSEHFFLLGAPPFATIKLPPIFQGHSLQVTCSEKDFTDQVAVACELGL